jgi:hypothetical protein
MHVLLALVPRRSASSIGPSPTHNRSCVVPGPPWKHISVECWSVWCLVWRAVVLWCCVLCVPPPLQRFEEAIPRSSGSGLSLCLAPSLYPLSYPLSLPHSLSSPSMLYLYLSLTLYPLPPSLSSSSSPFPFPLFLLPPPPPLFLPLPTQPIFIRELRPTSHPRPVAGRSRRLLLPTGTTAAHLWRGVFRTASRRGHAPVFPEIPPVPNPPTQRLAGLLEEPNFRPGWVCGLVRGMSRIKIWRRKVSRECCCDCWCCPTRA